MIGLGVRSRRAGARTMSSVLCGFVSRWAAWAARARPRVTWPLWTRSVSPCSPRRYAAAGRVAPPLTPLCSLLFTALCPKISHNTSFVFPFPQFPTNPRPLATPGGGRWVAWPDLPYAYLIFRFICYCTRMLVWLTILYTYNFNLALGIFTLKLLSLY